MQLYYLHVITGASKPENIRNKPLDSSPFPSDIPHGVTRSCAQRAGGPVSRTADVLPLNNHSIIPVLLICNSSHVCEARQYQSAPNESFLLPHLPHFPRARPAIPCVVYLADRYLPTRRRDRRLCPSAKKETRTEVQTVTDDY